MLPRKFGHKRQYIHYSWFVFLIAALYYISKQLAENYSKPCWASRKWTTHNKPCMCINEYPHANYITLVSCSVSNLETIYRRRHMNIFLKVIADWCYSSVEWHLNLHYSCHHYLIQVLPFYCNYNTTGRFYHRIYPSISPSLYLRFWCFHWALSSLSCHTLTHSHCSLPFLSNLFISLSAAASATVIWDVTVC